MPDTTSRLSLPFPESTDSPDGAAQIEALAESLDDAVLYDQGVAASRPVSTAPSPGIAGRFYYSTDTGVLEQDTGTGWRIIPISGAGQIGTTSIADEAVTGAKLADDVVGQWRTLMQASSVFTVSHTDGVYLLGTAGAPFKSGVSAANFSVPMIHLVAADYAVTGRTTKLRLRIATAANSVAPTCEFNATLRTASGTIGGSGGSITWTTGILVGSDTLAIEPVGGLFTTSASPEFDLPTDGVYAFGVELDGGMASGSAVAVSVSLQLRHV